MSRLKRLIVEIHRRSLWQVVGIYVVGAWIALQVADTVSAALRLPDRVPQLALVLLIVLLPVVLFGQGVTELRPGVGTLEFGSTPADPLGSIPVLEILRAACYEHGFTLDYGEFVYDYLAEGG